MRADLPAPDTDSKSEAFYLLADTTKLRFQTQYASTWVSFVSANNPMTLMTNNGINFERYPVYGEWRAAFGHDRSGIKIVSSPRVFPVMCLCVCMHEYQLRVSVFD